MKLLSKSQTLFVATLVTRFIYNYSSNCFGYLLALILSVINLECLVKSVDANLGLFEVAFCSKRCCRIWRNFAVAPGFFAWMGAFTEMLLLLIGFQTRIASFL
jgi:hypothetical protein